MCDYKSLPVEVITGLSSGIHSLEYCWNQKCVFAIEQMSSPCSDSNIQDQARPIYMMTSYHMNRWTTRGS
jgi:hypothetical protein